MLTLFYTFEGGMTAVIWTDVVQMSLYVSGSRPQLFRDPGQTFPADGRTWSRWPARPHKFTDLRFPLRLQHGILRPHLHLLGGRCSGGCFLTTASHGTDQLMVQRLLSARNEPQSRAALLASWLVIFVQFTLFLLIGVLLFVYYGDAHLAAAGAVRPHLRVLPVEQPARRAWRGCRSPPSWRPPWPT